MVMKCETKRQHNPTLFITDVIHEKLYEAAQKLTVCISFITNLPFIGLDKNFQNIFRRLVIGVDVRCDNGHN